MNAAGGIEVEFHGATVLQTAVEITTGAGLGRQGPAA
jgi:hypothetical protein